MKPTRLAFAYTPEIETLRYPADCPFKVERAGRVRERLRAFGLLATKMREELCPQPARREELERFHTPRYLDELQRAAGGELRVEGLQMGLGGPDTPVFPHLYTYGAWACGASLAGAEALLEGRFDVVFNLMGGLHHAMAERASGFCYLNDVVLACLRLADAGKRVACLDVDAHHGDGTQAAFYARSDVLTISLHESGKTLFPWGGFENECGDGPGLGYNVNVPLPAGAYDAAFLEAVDRVVMPLLGAYAPDVLVLELGMDTLAGDPLTHLNLTNNVHVELINRLLSLDRPVLVLGGGGYHVENTVRGWTLAWQAFCGEQSQEDEASAGLGGVLLGSTEWAGGLRDPVRPVPDQDRERVEPVLKATIQAVIQRIFPHHGLESVPVAGRGSTAVG